MRHKTIAFSAIFALNKIQFQWVVPITFPTSYIPAVSGIQYYGKLAYLGSVPDIAVHNILIS